MRILKLLLLCLLQLSCTGQENEKINGVSFVASREPVTETQVAQIVKVHANHAAVMPFGFIRDIHSPEIVFDSERQWFGETSKGASQYIGELQKKGVKVMVKPQIWIWRGAFTGTLKMQSEKDWKTLETSYEAFILAYAKVAQKMKVDLFCIGTELQQFVTHRPAYWTALIKKIRAVYKGKLTYAANWDEYPKTPFWEELDFIGIDAYFPLSDARNPTMEQLREGWKPWKTKIAALAESKGKPVLFTEFGYRSMDFTGKKPWLVDAHDMQVNLQAQADATQVIFETFWPEDWFAGGYIWKWFIKHENAGGAEDNRFTPQNKPAQQVLSEFYKKY